MEHILQAIDNLQRFTNDCVADDVQENGILFFALVKNIEIIGEASYMLTNEFRESHPTTEWRDIIAMRHVLVHGYHTISPGHVWSVIQQDIPVLKTQIETFLTEFE